MPKKRIDITDAERHRRSVQITVRNQWAKEGKPGGEEELKRRRSDPKVLVPLYKKKGWPVPVEFQEGKTFPARPAGSPKKGPPQPPPPPKSKASPPAAAVADSQGLDVDLFD